MSNAKVAYTASDDVQLSEIGSLAKLIHLLPFQRHIIRSLIPGASGVKSDNPDDDDPDVLLVMAKGLGMRTIVASVLRLYDGPTNLVLIIDATKNDEDGLREELQTMGVRRPGLQSITFTTSVEHRQEIYLSGGLISVTSRILIADMIENKIPIDLITGLVVMHAEKVTPKSIENFIVSVFREHNKDGFVKAFSDQPQRFAVGLSPLQMVMSNLHLRRAELWPRFHKDVIRDLGRKKADVIELHQSLSRSMKRIQNAVVECIDATLNELKKGTGQIDVDEANIENAIFEDFEGRMQRVLAQAWDKIGFKTRGLMDDIDTLRTILRLLLSSDSVKFLEHIESVSLGDKGGTVKGGRKQWLVLPAADTMFREAKARAYLGEIQRRAPVAPTAVHDDGFDPDEEEALLAAEGMEQQGKPAKKRPSWLPPGIEPTLEELPKWHLLREVLDEIEQDIHWADADLTRPKNNSVLIMVADGKVRAQIQHFLHSMKTSVMGSAGRTERPGKKMMERSLRRYFEWKRDVGQVQSNLRNPQFNVGPNEVAKRAFQPGANNARRADAQEDPRLRNKEIWENGLAPLQKRRRQRKGLNGTTTIGSGKKGTSAAAESIAAESEEVMMYYNDENHGSEEEDVADDQEDPALALNAADDMDGDLLEDYFGILDMKDIIVVRPYSNDDDDNHLQEFKPRFVVMYDADPAFIRRLEVYRAAHNRDDLRVYFLMYAESVEEQRYLSGIRREKESFERLIREKANMALTLHADGPSQRYRDEGMLRTINSRMAGGQNEATNAEHKVIVDTREIRSDLPHMLYRSDIKIQARTLQVGDYILSSSMCVERKSLSDLVGSFNSGRLYDQCEMMCIHYQHPILLIEFEGKKFEMNSMNETKSGATTARMMSNAALGITMGMSASEMDTQAKLILLTLTFPRLRVIWSASSEESAKIFLELKQNYEEPDADIAASIGANDAGEGDLTAHAMLLSLPGVNSKNYTLISREVRDMEDLCSLTQAELNHLIGSEQGRKLHDFLHKNAIHSKAG